MVKNDNEYSIEGLVTLASVEKLIDGGYKVLVKKEATRKTPAVEETMSFQDLFQDVGKENSEVHRDRRSRPRSPSSPLLMFTAYLSVEGIDSTIQRITNLYPNVAEIINLPEKTHEGRICRALKIGVGPTSKKKGLLFIAGVHAREILNPDLLVRFALAICQAYTTNAALTFGGRSYDTNKVKQIFKNLELYIFPLVNPDGRSFVQSPSGDVWWRKNRNPNPGLESPGVDLNRNYDFLWASGIGTSADSTTEIYKGKEPNSEPESKNVIHLINKYKNITCVVDIHSYSELVLYPWGDDENQVNDPNMNFRNSTYDGIRGHPGDTVYREYIIMKDLDWYISAGNKINEGITSVRRRTYKVQPGVNLYPTSGTCHDFVYSLQFVRPGRRLMGFTVETAKRFQPSYSEASSVMSEVSTGLVELCLEFAAVR
jgi:murein tripeptide amidase MpaA